jgi:acyl-CoA reductase-like NAD-dependent aldehyde dehydrogenase
MAVPVLRSHVGGRWVSGDEEYELVNPATAEVLARVSRAGTDEVESGVAAARASFEEVRWSPTRERAALCHRVADLIADRAESLAVELVEEHGKPLQEARAEIAAGLDGFRLTAEEIKRLDGYLPQTQNPSKRVLVIRQARGVWALLTPWNYPFNIPIEYLGPALATGSPFVWKPAPRAPASPPGLPRSC